MLRAGAAGTRPGGGGAGGGCRRSCRSRRAPEVERSARRGAARHLVSALPQPRGPWGRPALSRTCVFLCVEARGPPAHDARDSREAPGRLCPSCSPVAARRGGSRGAAARAPAARRRSLAAARLRAVRRRALSRAGPSRLHCSVHVRCGAARRGIRAVRGLFRTVFASVRMPLLLPSDDVWGVRASPPPRGSPGGTQVHL